MPSRQDQYRLNVTVDGVSLGLWDDKTGGDTDSNSTQYFLGGMGPRISLGGPPQVNNVVVQKLQDADILARGKWLQSRAGKATAKISQQPLDDEGNVLGEPYVWQGKLKRVKIPDVQSQSNSAAQWELELEVDGQVA